MDEPLLDALHAILARLDEAALSHAAAHVAHAIALLGDMSEGDLNDRAIDDLAANMFGPQTGQSA